MTKKLIKKYRNRALSLDFKEIKLTQLGDGNSDSFVGPGQIEQNKKGALTYKLFHNSEVGIEDFFGRFNELVAGELIPEDHYYSFKGTDIHGRTWSSERVDVDYHTCKNFTVVQEKLKKVQTATTLPSNDGKERTGEFHQIWIPKKIKLPANLSSSVQHFVGEDEMKSSFNHSAAEYENDFLKTLLFHDDDWLIIQIKVDEDDFHPFILERVLSSLQYILAEPMNWVIYEKRIKNKFISTFRPYKEKHEKSRFREPILIADQNESSVWKLFDAYLKYILQNKQDFNDPITNIISKCLAASQGSFDAFSLTLGLSIEEILNTSFTDLKVKQSVKDEDILSLKNAIKKLDIEDRLRDRVASYIGHIQQTSASDRLRQLVDNTSITRSDYDDWKAIRNHFAHPDESKLETQDKVDKTYSVLTLLHKLIFIKIGYEGSYNNYGERGWAQEEWVNQAND